MDNASAATTSRPARAWVGKLRKLPRQQRKALFRQIPPEEQGLVLLNLGTRIRRDLLKNLSGEELLKLSHHIDPDQTTDLLQDLEEKARQKVLNQLSQELKAKVEFLLRFHPQTAAGLMSLDYIMVNHQDRLKDVAKVIQKHEQRTGKTPAVFISRNGKFVGELPLHILALKPESEPVRKHAQKIPRIIYNEKEAAVVKMFRRHPHNKIAVLDDDGSVLGVIYSDDILQIIDQQSTNTLYHFSGVNREEDILDSAWAKVQSRYKWLILNLGTAFMAAFVVSLFQKTIARAVLLAAYMPIVAGMGGNAGTQTLAVTIRGLALREVDLRHSRKVIGREMAAGAINGIMNGAIVALVAILLNHNPLLGIVVAIAMVVNLIVAGLFGALVPLVMQQLGKDPASSATIFITTATDILGFLTLLSLASLLFS